MWTLMAAVVLFLLFFLLMSVGLLQKKPIKGSCGGVGGKDCVCAKTGKTCDKFSNPKTGAVKGVPVPSARRP